ncbi:DMT family transporter [Allopontixanthobacter sp.]|uniref:DMT family transporter n=1 Tax=Allopontixanthobacter sp. TaxID=2906452 RepID=UPI002AB9EB8B|nr:DMT family transporter [Allopontixanthobacter sp.]MDZ4307678.1 DMT family transporter [Allopontixanthobacter sp.]
MLQFRAFLPFLAALAGVGFLSLMDAFMKSASLAAGAYSAAVLRSAIAAAIILPIWLGTGGRWPQRSVLRLHLIRGTVSGFMALSFFYALTKLPIAEAIAISFVAPLIALYLAAILLGEQIRREAIVASVLGLAGTGVIIGARLGSAEYDTETLKGLGAILFSALLYAYNFIVIRKQAQVSSPLEATTFHSGVACAVLAVFAPWFLILPAAGPMGDIAVASVLTLLGSLLITFAYARAEAQALVPMEYSGFLWAALFGWLFFREPVTAATIAGTLLIVAGCWIVARPRPAMPQTEQTAI